MQAKFNIGQETGRKIDPVVVSSQMRKALDPDGKRLFNVSEFVSPQQVKSYFSRHAAKVRQQCDVLAEDIIVADEEANFCLLRVAACSNIQLQHLIEFTKETSATKGTIPNSAKRSCLQMLLPDPFHVMEYNQLIMHTDNVQKLKNHLKNQPCHHYWCNPYC